MQHDIKIVLIKFTIITIATFIFIGIMAWYVSPILVQQVLGQSAFDSGIPQQYGQQQYDSYNQQGYQQGYQDPYQSQYNQGYQQPYNQGYQQYGTPTYSPYGMQATPAPYPQNTVLGFGVQEIVTALIAGGGATAYARRRTNSLENDKQLIMAEMMRDKQKLAELARVSYQKMPLQGNEITDAPAVKLETLNNDIDKFTEQVSKA
jgi:hypothetical protein